MPVRRTYGSKRSVALNPSSHLIFAIEDTGPVASHGSTRDELSELSQLASRLNIQDGRNTVEEDETIAVKDTASEEGFVRSGKSRFFSSLRSAGAHKYQAEPLLQVSRTNSTPSLKHSEQIQVSYPSSKPGPTSSHQSSPWRRSLRPHLQRSTELPITMARRLYSRSCPSSCPATPPHLPRNVTATSKLSSLRSELWNT